MSVPVESGVQLPVVTGDHIRYVLAQGREDQALFMRQERQWLSENNPRLAHRILSMYELGMQRGSKSPDAFLAGAMMGHRAVRYACVQTETDYEVPARQFELNWRRAKLNPDTLVPWSTAPALTAVFGDENDTPQALMEVSHTSARDSAAFIIAYCTFPSIPSAIEAVTQQVGVATEVPR
jgi:hypothetical protein